MSPSLHKRCRAAACAVIAAAFSFRSAIPAQGADVPAVSDLDTSSSEMRPVIDRWNADRGNLQRYYNIADSPERRARLRRFHQETKASLAALNFDAMSQDGKIDYILFRNELDHELRRLDLEEKEAQENAVWLPFSASIVQLEEARQKMDPIDPAKTAQALLKLNKEIETARTASEALLRADTGAEAVRKRRIVGNRAATEAASLRNTLRTWFNFYDGYDPMFTWWDEEAYRSADESLNSYATFLRERVAGLRVNASAAAETPAAGAGRGAPRIHRRHCRQPHRPRRADERTGLRNDSLHAGAAAHSGQPGIRLVPGGNEEGFERNGHGGRLEIRARKSQDHVRRARQAAADDSRSGA
jgi:hypothetical protein